MATSKPHSGEADSPFEGTHQENPDVGSEWGVSLVAGPRAELASETRQLLQSRLRAASLVFCGSASLFLALWLAIIRRTASIDRWQLAAHCGVILLTGGVGALLSVGGTPSLRTLRRLQIVVFGAPATYVTIIQYQQLISSAEVGRFSMTSGVIPGWYILIFVYGMFIPNTWRRAAVDIGLLALTPVMVIGLGALTHESVRTAFSPFMFSQICGLLTVGAVAATYGAHTVGTLRHEAFEARRFGEYRLRRLLNSGGMGDVYLAEHRLLKRPCAIKVIRPSRSAEPLALERFEREVRVTATLTHWNTVEIFDYGRATDGTFYYVMEYLPGMTLAQLVDRHGPLPAARVVHMMRQVCDALGDAHRIGLIHRDLKPGNVMATERGGVYDVIKVFDFGLVKPEEEMRIRQPIAQDGLAGSPLYMSPEQATGDSPSDRRSDLYSLGAVMYFLLTGRPPFVGASAIEALAAHAYDSPTPPSGHVSGVPADLEAVVLRCLAKDPADRYQNSGELAEALAATSVAGAWSRAAAESWWNENAMAELHPELSDHAA